MGHASQWVVLVHELRELGGSEELLDRSNHRANIDQGLRGDRLDVLGGHTFTYNALHTGQAGADLVVDQFADRADAAVAEVVDVIDVDRDVGLFALAYTLDGALACVEGDYVADHRYDVGLGQNGGLWGVHRHVHAELAVELVAAHLSEVVALRGEVHVLKQVACRFNGRRLAWAQLAVDVQQRFFLGVDGVLLEGDADRLVVAELFEDLGFGPAEGLEQYRHGLLALTVEADTDLVALIDFELEPGTTGWDDARGVDVLIGGLVWGALEVGTWGTDQLGHNDALGSVDDERCVVGHEREIAHEDRLLLDFAGLVVHELGTHVERCRVGGVAVFGFRDRVLRVREFRLGEAQGHGALEVFDG